MRVKRLGRLRPLALRMRLADWPRADNRSATETDRDKRALARNSSRMSRTTENHPSPSHTRPERAMDYRPSHNKLARNRPVERNRNKRLRDSRIRDRRTHNYVRLHSKYGAYTHAHHGNNRARHSRGHDRNLLPACHHDADSRNDVLRGHRD